MSPSNRGSHLRKRAHLRGVQALMGAQGTGAEGQKPTGPGGRGGLPLRSLERQGKGGGGGLHEAAMCERAVQGAKSRSVKEGSLPVFPFLCVSDCSLLLCPCDAKCLHLLLSALSTRSACSSADVCIAFRRDSLSRDFLDRNAETLNLRRGAGYWIWKPYLIFKVLMEVQEGDVVMYSEFAAEFKQDLAPTFSLPDAMNQDVVFFEHPHGEEGGPRYWSKGDVLTIMDCYNNSCTEEAPHVTTAYSVWKKSEESVLLASYWMSYMEDPRVATDLGDTLGFPNLLYRTGEHQESAVAGITAYKWGLKPAPKESLGGLVSL